MTLRNIKRQRRRKSFWTFIIAGDLKQLNQNHLKKAKVNFSIVWISIRVPFPSMMKKDFFSSSCFVLELAFAFRFHLAEVMDFWIDCNLWITSAHGNKSFCCWKLMRERRETLKLFWRFNSNLSGICEVLKCSSAEVKIFDLTIWVSVVQNKVKFWESVSPWTKITISKIRWTLFSPDKVYLKFSRIETNNVAFWVETVIVIFFKTDFSVETLIFFLKNQFFLQNSIFLETFLRFSILKILS